MYFDELYSHIQQSHNMKSYIYLLLLLGGISFSSCQRGAYILNGNSSIERQDELKGFAFARNEGNGNLSGKKMEVEKVVGKALHRKNFIYDTEHPDFLVFIDEMPPRTKLLTGNTYTTSTGQELLEPTKFTTRKNTLLIQLVETKSYQTVWRGFSSDIGGTKAVNLLPVVARALMNQ